MRLSPTNLSPPLPQTFAPTSAASHSTPQGGLQEVLGRQMASMLITRPYLFMRAIPPHSIARSCIIKIVVFARLIRSTAMLCIGARSEPVFR